MYSPEETKGTSRLCQRRSMKLDGTTMGFLLREGRCVYRRLLETFIDYKRRNEASGGASIRTS